MRSKGGVAIRCDTAFLTAQRRKIMTRGAMILMGCYLRVTRRMMRGS